MIYEIKCEVDIPDNLGTTCQEVEDWVRFNLNENGSLGPSPIQEYPFEARAFSVRVEPATRYRERSPRVLRDTSGKNSVTQ